MSFLATSRLLGQALREFEAAVRQGAAWWERSLTRVEAARHADRRDDPPSETDTGRASPSPPTRSHRAGHKPAIVRSGPGSG
jgi:hypothetical protein